MKRKKDLNSGIIFSYLLTFAFLFIVLSGKVSYFDEFVDLYNVNKINHIYDEYLKNNRITYDLKSVYKAAGYFRMVNGAKFSKKEPIVPNMIIDGDYFYVYKSYNYSFLFYRDDPGKIYYKNILVWDDDKPTVDDLNDIEDTIYNTDCYLIRIADNNVKVYKSYDVYSDVIGEVNSGFESYSLQHGDYYGEYWTNIYLPDIDEYGWINGSGCFDLLAH